MRVYSAQGQRQAVSLTYDRCRAALESLGLRASPALEAAQQAAMPPAPTSALAGHSAQARLRPLHDERRLVSVLFAELSGPVGMGRRLDPEEVRQTVGGALTGLIAEVEGLGGTVTAVSGAGLVALFGAPEAHEDDPERAVRAGGRMMSVIASGGHAPGAGALSVRAGIETGPAVIGSLGGRVRGGGGGRGRRRRSPVGGQSGLGPGRPGHSCRHRGCLRVGADRRGGPHPRGQAPCRFLPGAAQGTARGLPRPGPAGGPRPLSGPPDRARHARRGVRGAISGTGSVVFVVGEPGLGKTRLVQECRKRFMAWVGASTGRLPLWLEGRAASYASSTPYGLYQQLLSAWVGAAPEEGDEVVRPALERAMKAIFGGH